MSAPVPGDPGRRRHRRVVALSPQDQERVAQGLEPLEVAETRHRRSLDALTDALSHDGGLLGRDASADERANDARLLRDVPPHWGTGPAVG